MLLGRFRAFGLVAVFCVGCSRDGSNMANDDRWSTIAELPGWQVYRQPLDAGEAIKRAHLRRHRDHSSFQPVSRVKPLSPSEAEQYGKLNEQLHEQLRRLSHEIFDSVPVPSTFTKRQREESYFTPFTYQNYDWYGPSYEVYISVLTDFISSHVLAKFQSLLKRPYKDWCIVVVGSDSDAFDHDHEVHLFSDEVITTEGDAKALYVPERHRLQVK
jgi:hypothetical protein